MLVKFLAQGTIRVHVTLHCGVVYIALSEAVFENDYVEAAQVINRADVPDFRSGRFAPFAHTYTQQTIKTSMHTTNSLFDKIREIVYMESVIHRNIMSLTDVFLKKFDELIANGKALPAKFGSMDERAVIFMGSKLR